MSGLEPGGTAAEGPGRPAPATSVDAPPDAVVDRLRAPSVPVPDDVRRRLADACAEVTDAPEARRDAGRDWWPLAIRWAMRGAVPARPEVVARPADADQVAAVMAVCHDARVPVTPVAGRSGVCGSSVPVFGGVALDLCGLSGLHDVDDRSLVADVAAGTFGPDLERQLGACGLTLGHWPQSMALSTVGGWVACRGAGQYSTRYGKIEDMVVGLQVVLPDGRRVTTGGAGPRAALGPDLTGLFVGAEGTLGVVTAARLRLHPAAPHQARAAWAFADFSTGLDACRRALRRGATPAVLRLYDATEAARSFGVDDGTALLIVLDEAELPLLQATMGLVATSARACGGKPADEALVDRWLEHRNDVSALAHLVRGGIVVDTVEVAARWAALPELHRRMIDALSAVDGTLVASAHQSHAYRDGACLYVTFAGRPPRSSVEAPPPADGSDGWAVAAADGGADDAWAEGYYVDAWATVMGVVAAAGGAISHHHGVGVNRARFMAGAPGVDLPLLQALKAAFDPRGICNPGKLGLASPFGEVAWPDGGAR